MALTSSIAQMPVTNVPVQGNDDPAAVAVYLSDNPTSAVVGMPVTFIRSYGSVQSITIYDENVEWPFVSSAANRLSSNSAVSPHTGLLSIFAVNAAPADFFTLTSPVPVVLSKYSALSLWVQPATPISWGALSFVNFSWESGQTVTLGSGRYGFDGTNLAYQNVIIPVADFGLTDGAEYQVLTVTTLPKNTMNFYMDTITLAP